MLFLEVSQTIVDFYDNLLRTFTYTLKYLKNGRSVDLITHISDCHCAIQGSFFKNACQKNLHFTTRKISKSFWVFVVKHENAKDLCVIDYLLMYHPLYGHRKYCRVCYEPMRRRNLVIKIARTEFLKYLFKFHFYS